MKRQKKYTSEEMIVRDIEAVHRKVRRLEEKVANLRADAELNLAVGAAEKARQSREAADKAIDQIHRLEHTRLKRLQDTLAAFQTIPLIPGESQVTLQPARK